jgi:hypothetical protein
MAVLFGAQRGDSSDDDSVPDLSTWKSNTMPKVSLGNTLPVAQMTQAAQAQSGNATDPGSESDGQQDTSGSNALPPMSRSGFLAINTPDRRESDYVSADPDSAMSENEDGERQNVDGDAVIEIVRENIDRSEYEDLSGGGSKVRCILRAVTDEDDNTLYEVAFGNYLVDQVSSATLAVQQLACDRGVVGIR